MNNEGMSSRIAGSFTDVPVNIIIKDIRKLTGNPKYDAYMLDTEKWTLTFESFLSTTFTKADNVAAKIALKSTKFIIPRINWDKNHRTYLILFLE